MVSVVAAVGFFLHRHSQQHSHHHHCGGSGRRDSGLIPGLAGHRLLLLSLLLVKDIFVHLCHVPRCRWAVVRTAACPAICPALIDRLLVIDGQGRGTHGREGRS